jgi:serine protease Do
MATSRLRPLLLLCAPLLAFVLALLPVAAADLAAIDPVPPAALDKPFPETKEELQAIQDHVKWVVGKVMASVVNVKNNAQGSGIVITEDGLVLTAGHVSGKPGQSCTLTFPDGKKVKGKSLGQNTTADSGLIKITEEGKYPFCEMGKSGELKKGQWCIAIGHPGGWKEGRTPPVRLGRIGGVPGAWVTTECTLVGGDSGGPLFDMHGKVIGIHSRIGNPINANMHVPSDSFKLDWDKLLKGDTWAAVAGTVKLPTARLGVAADPDYEGKGIKLKDVVAGGPAEKAGLKVDDIITSLNGKALNKFEDLKAEIDRRQPGDEITLEIRRGGETLTLKAVLEKIVQ